MSDDDNNPRTKGDPAVVFAIIGGLVGLALLKSKPDGVLDFGDAVYWIMAAAFATVGMLIGSAFGMIVSKNRPFSLGDLNWGGAGLFGAMFVCAAVGQHLAGSTGAWIGFAGAAVAMFCCVSLFNRSNTA